MNNNLQQGTILIVDDNPTNLEVVYGVLDDNGYEILVEMDGESGIQQARTNLPDLILLDIMMPGIDGFETCRRLKSDRILQDIPIIFMTALTDTKDKVKGFKLGAVDYITKPFNKEEIMARIQVHLQLRQMSLELTEYNERLERRVEERTAKLYGALEDLKSAQLQLVQAEKMSGLGQLVAGVAHEVNNPIGFIHGNVQHLEEYIQHIIEFLNLYQTFYPTPKPEIEEMREEFDLDFMIDDIPKLINSMKMGVTRIRQIVSSLRNFSYLDRAGKQPTDIHEGLKSTLLILSHRLKPTDRRAPIQIATDYGDLPEVECHAGQLNQVFMNLLSNAIDALEEESETMPEVREIKISTTIIENNFARISIKDNGTGISEEVRTKIFDPFFTTKPVGKGTGLGLSISYQIVTEGHGGQLLCESKLREGTEFIIQIPMKAKSEEQSDRPLPS